MKRKHNYIIEHKKLSKGNHSLSYIIDENFFDLFSFSEINKGNIKLDVNLQINENIVVGDFSFSGIIKTTCDVCLEKLNLKISDNVRLFFKITDRNLKNEEQIIYICEEDEFIDFSKPIYDYIILSIPIKKVHPLDENGKRTCNQEVLKRLEKHKKNNKINNIPGWDKLKKSFNQ